MIQRHVAFALRMAFVVQVRLPYDAHLAWSGEINERKEAEARLKVIIPLTLLLIGFLTYTAVKNWPSPSYAPPSLGDERDGPVPAE
jgi:Cu/Ag efflux pump CusA